MLDLSVVISLTLLSVSIVGCVYRVVKGPSMPDRIIALDMIGIHLIGIVALLSIWLETPVLLDMILLIGILAFLGTVAFSKYLERGVVMEHEQDPGNRR